MSYQGILFDFGGTLDADGLTWKERFFRLFREEHVSIAPAAFDPHFYAADDALVGTLPETLGLRDSLGRLGEGLWSGPARCAETTGVGTGTRA